MPFSHVVAERAKVESARVFVTKFDENQRAVRRLNLKQVYATKLSQVPGREAREDTLPAYSTIVFSCCGRPLICCDRPAISAAWDQGGLWAIPAANSKPKFRLDHSGWGENRPVWNQSAKRGGGANVGDCVLVCFDQCKHPDYQYLTNGRELSNTTMVTGKR